MSDEIGRNEQRIDLEDLKRIQVEILNHFVAYCESHGLNYWIDGGTLIGAVRHKGYIPWDDDIDTGMLRNDFEYVIANFNDENDRYQCWSCSNNNSFAFPFAKIVDTHTKLIEKGDELCVNIDLFVYDEVPDNRRIIKRLYDYRDFCINLNMLRKWTNTPNGNLFRRLVIYTGRFLVRPFPKNYFSKKVLSHAGKYNGQGYQYVGNFVGVRRLKCNKRVFDSFIELEFEGKMYKAPSGYDEWLTEFYGDYMELPPIEKQVSHHTFEAYYIEKRQDE